MSYKIGIIGHIKNIKFVEEIISTTNKDIELLHFEFVSVSEINSTIQYIHSQSKYLDGIIFTGKIPFELIKRAMDQELPFSFIEHNQSNLQRTLLEANLKYNYDITSISIDSFDLSTVYETYNEFGLNENEIDVHVSPIDIFSDDMLAKITQFHMDNITKNNISFCITGISSVHDELTRLHIPCLLLKPTADAVKSVTNNLLLTINSIQNTESQIVVISIEIDMPDEYHLINENEYQLMLEKTHVTEEVYIFAERIQAAVVEQGVHNYMLFSTKKAIESETHGFKSVPILKAVSDHTSHTISMGLGFGSTAKAAKVNASKGLNRSLKNGGNQAYIVKNSDYIGPIHPEAITSEIKSPISDSIYQQISDATNISVNTIYRLHCIKEKNKTSYFTSKELASEFEISTRSMNRIIKKLELEGYIQIEGSRIMTTSGRPSRILKLLF